MNQMGLSHNAKTQMFCPIIQVSHRILGNPTRCVYNHICELRKVIKLERGVEIIGHFVQISLANFDSCNVITHKNISTLHKFH